MPESGVCDIKLSGVDPLTKSNTQYKSTRNATAMNSAAYSNMGPTDHKNQTQRLEKSAL